MDVALQRLLRVETSQPDADGLRGVGKTVLLVEFETLAESRGYFHDTLRYRRWSARTGTGGAFRRCCLPWTQSAASESEFEERSHTQSLQLETTRRLEISIDVDAVAGPRIRGIFE